MVRGHGGAKLGGQSRAIARPRPLLTLRLLGWQEAELTHDVAVFPREGAGGSMSLPVDKGRLFASCGFLWVVHSRLNPRGVI